MQQEIYLYIHVSKSGGTSIKSVLKDWYGKKLFHYRAIEMENSLLKRTALPFMLKNKKMIFGHFTNHHQDLVKKHIKDTFKKIIVLRDPLQTQISRFFALRRRMQNGLIIAKKDHVDKEFLHSLDGFLLNSPGFYRDYLPQNINLENYKDVIDREFAYAGTIENIHEMLEGFAISNNFEFKSVPHYRKTYRKEFSLNENIIDSFKEKYDLEYKIYNFLYDKV